jgi:hypothetical protein
MQSLHVFRLANTPLPAPDRRSPGRCRAPWRSRWRAEVLRFHLAHLTTSIEEWPAIALLSVHRPSCLDLNCRVSARALNLGRDRCKSGQYKISEHLGREAVRYDEHYSLILGEASASTLRARRLPRSNLLPVARHYLICGPSVCACLPRGARLEMILLRRAAPCCRPAVCSPKSRRDADE